MTYQTETDVVQPVQPVVRSGPAYVTAATEVRRTTYRPSPLATLERLIVFIFTVIELLIVARIVLLLVSARESNGIVQFVYNVSDIFVAPFRGILGINEVQSGAAALDIAAIVALIGWVIVELVVIALVRVFRPAATA